MRNPAAISTHGSGKSRSKPLAKMHHSHTGKTLSKKMVTRYRGYQKMMGLYEAVIKHTAAPIKVHMKKTNFSVKQGIKSMVSKALVKKQPIKLNINR